MKFSEQWLREWVGIRLSCAALAELLTMSGLEVESVSPWRAPAGGAKPGRDEPRLPAADRILELALTPNRGDCLGVRGLAREIALLTGAKLRRPARLRVGSRSRTRRRVQLAAPAACPRYAGCVLEGIDASRPTPQYIAERLLRSGLRPVSVVVDITNYVMLESGQPMHAFDDARLVGPITVRMGRRGESLTLLDGRRCDLSPDMLVIADRSGPVALAGIMGGADSAVSAATASVFLESAWFAPDAIAGRARRLGLQTDASYRFERGCDPQMQADAVEQATALILKHCGGCAGPITDAKQAERLPKPRRIRLRRSRLSELLGIDLDARAVGAILKRLAPRVRAERTGWTITAPVWRHDLALEADLIEEVARIHGYRRIPGRRLSGSIGMRPGGTGPRWREWRRLLAGRGYFEAITYSFVDGALQTKLLGEVAAIRLLNPIASDQGVMRVSLWPGLLQALRGNLARQRSRVRLFESGRVYGPGSSGAPVERTRLAGMITGNTYPEQWDIKSSESDFFDLKSDVEALLKAASLPAPPAWAPLEHPALQPGQAAEIRVGNQKVGILGALHPGILRALDLPPGVQAFELDVEALPAASRPPFQAPSRYPAMRRDVALEVDSSLPAARLLEAVREVAGPILDNLELFDVYQGEGIDLGKKSVALGLIFQKTSSTLIEEEVEAELRKILNFLRDKFGASLRS
jgi:phenylalanyl-tRNA synthetase beta chain